MAHKEQTSSSGQLDLRSRDCRQLLSSSLLFLALGLLSILPIECCAWRIQQRQSCNVALIEQTAVVSVEVQGRGMSIARQEKLLRVDSVGHPRIDIFFINFGSEAEAGNWLMFVRSLGFSKLCFNSERTNIFLLQFDSFA